MWAVVFWIALFVVLIAAVRAAFGKCGDGDLGALVFLVGLSIVLTVAAGLALRYHVLGWPSL